MTRAEKTDTIEALKEKFAKVEYFYLTDSSTLTVEEVTNFRRLCFEQGIEMRVVKNTLVRKALEASPEEKNYKDLIDSLKGPTAILFTDTANAPARILKKFRKDHEKPVLKAAYIDTDVIVGDEKIEMLSQLKSKEELIGDVLALLQSPIRNLASALQSGEKNIMGILQTLEERHGEGSE